LCRYAEAPVVCFWIVSDLTPRNHPRLRHGSPQRSRPVPDPCRVRHGQRRGSACAAAPRCAGGCTRGGPQRQRPALRHVCQPPGHRQPAHGQRRGARAGQQRRFVEHTRGRPAERQASGICALSARVSDVLAARWTTLVNTASVDRVRARDNPRPLAAAPCEGRACPGRPAEIRPPQTRRQTPRAHIPPRAWCSDGTTQ